MQGLGFKGVPRALGFRAEGSKGFGFRALDFWILGLQGLGCRAAAGLGFGGRECGMGAVSPFLHSGAGVDFRTTDLGFFGS